MLKDGFKNIICEFIYYILNITFNLIIRKQIIKYIGIEVVALNHILNQIINFITLVEFGICNIMVFNLYSAIKEKNKDKINDIMNIFKKIYKRITILILTIGIFFIPFIKYFINGYDLSINYIIIYILLLLQISCTFLFSYKIYLLQANQKSYVYLLIMIISKILSSIIEISALIIFKNYYLYTSLFVINNLLMHYIISKYVDRNYNFLETKSININEYKEIKKHIKKTATSKVCSVLKQNTDTYLLGLLSTIKIVGLYSNYYLIMHSVCYMVQKIFDSLKAIFGIIITNESNEKNYKIFNIMNNLSYIIGFICSILFYLFINIIIKVWLEKEYLMSNSISLALSIQIFITIYRISLWQFIEIKGWFNISKITDLIGIGINFILSIILYFKLGVIGIIIGTIISELVQYILEYYFVLKKLKTSNFNSILLVLLYIYMLFVLKYNYYIFIISISIATIYVVIYLKKSFKYVFTSKRK